MQNKSINKMDNVGQFVQLIPLDVNLECETKFNFKEKNISTLPSQIHSLLPAARKIDLSNNPLVNLEPLAQLKTLGHLTLSGCPNVNLTTLGCAHLVVFSIANCGLNSLQGLQICRNTLKTLVANDNNLQILSPEEVEAKKKDVNAQVRFAKENFEILASLIQLQTLILSRNKNLCGLSTVSPPAEGEEFNQLTQDEKQEQAASHPLSVFEKLALLKKLSLSECGIRNLPTRWFLPMLTELRLANNQLRSFQPNGVILRSIKILDVSNNALTTINTLRRCRFVKQINLKGNTLAEMTEDAGQGAQEGGTSPLKKKLLELFPNIESVDGIPIGDLSQNQANNSSKTEQLKLEKVAKTSGEENKAGKGTKKRNVVESGDSHNDDLIKVEAEKEEEEEKDVVVEFPDSNAKTNHVPIVKRQRTLSANESKNLKFAGESAVSALKKMKTNSAW